jgi:hypothetical protein
VISSSTSLREVTDSNSEYNRRHLVRDLQPYNCPLDDCATPFVFFTKKEELLRHLENAHLTMSYLQCRLCGESGPFEDALALTDHFQARHGDDLLEEDFQTALEASTHCDVDWPKRCPVCHLNLVEYQPISSSPLKEHLRREHRVDVLDEDVEKIVDNTAGQIDNCPECSVAIGPAQSVSRIDHLSQCLHDFSLRALPWNDHRAPAPTQDVGERLRIEQWIDKSPETFRVHDRLGTPPLPESIDEDNLDKLHILFPGIRLSDHPAKQPDTAWSQDFSTLEDSDVMGSLKTLPLDDNRYFNEENDASLCLISDELLETFDLCLRYAIAVIESCEHKATSTLLDELEYLRSSPFANGQSLQSALCHLGRPDGPFREFGESLLLSENAQLHFQRLDRISVLIE